MILFWEASSVISFVLPRNYLFKVCNLNTRTCVLRMSMLTIFNINDVNGVVLVSLIVNCEHISNCVLIIDFERAKVCLVCIENAITFEDKIDYIMHYVVIF